MIFKKKTKSRRAISQAVSNFEHIQPNLLKIIFNVVIFLSQILAWITFIYKLQSLKKISFF